MPELTSYDQYILSGFIQQLSGYRLFFYLVTQLGSPMTLAIIGALALVLGKKKLKAFGAVLIVGMLIAIPVIGDVKDIVKRPRPESAKAYGLAINNSYSFPSGHALSIFLAATLLGAFFGWRFYAAGYFIAIAVSLSRLYLGVHYPSDILAGAAIGIVMGELLACAAYRMGLCDIPGLLSYLRPPAAPAKSPPPLSGAAKIRGSWILALLAAVASTVFYYFHYRALMLFIIALSSLFILYAMLCYKGTSPGTLMLFILSSAALLSVYSLYFLDAMALSLSILVVSCIFITDALAKNILARRPPSAPTREGK